MDRELIDRYLAGRLDEAAQARVEERLLAEASLLEQAELTESLRAGLRGLDARGELDRLGSPAPRLWERPAFALAASLVAGLLALTSLALYEQLRGTRQAVAALERDLALRTPSPVAVVSVLTLVHTRSAGGVDLVSKLPAGPTLLELHLDAGLVPEAAYRVSLERVAGASRTLVLRVPQAAPSAQGEVVVALNSAVLQPGDYTIELVGPAPGAAPDVYTWRVER